MILERVKRHWPEYLMEAAGLGIFMISAATFATILEHPASPIRQAIADPLLRRIPMGLAMGLTAISIIYSPWGKQSGAHINPAVTLTFFRLGKIETWDTVFYVAAQFIGGATGVILISAIIGEFLSAPSVNYVATLPGIHGIGIAFLAESVISFGLMMTVLISTNHNKLAPFTGIFAGILVATYIIVEAPLSGMSMNPARTFASSLSAWLWNGLWIYFTAPVLGMFLAAQVYIAIKGKKKIYCAKLNHQNRKRCIFRCSYKNLQSDTQT